MALPTPRARTVGKLSDQVARFDAHANDHAKKQLENPFSSWEGASTKVKLSKTDENYGLAGAGTKSQARVLKAQADIKNAIEELLRVIVLLSPDQHAVLFKDLFDTYSRISDMLVGVMIRARRAGYITFEGEMLYQGRDDKQVVRLTPVGFERYCERGISPS